MTSKKDLISKLDRQSKEELARLLKQKAYIAKETKLERFFNPEVKEVKPNPIQEPFFKSQATIRALFSGNGSGKSTSLMLELIMAHTRAHPYRSTDHVETSWVICPSYQKIPDYIKTLKEWCPPSQLPKIERLGTPHDRKWTWANGSTTTFFSAEQDPDQLEGTNLDALFIDEPIDRALYIASLRGLRSTPGHYIIFAGTALSQPWLYQDIYLRGLNPADTNVEVFQGSVYDNADNIDPAWLKEFETSLTEDEKQVRLYGGFAVLQGRVFKEFDRRTHVIPFQAWPKHWPVYVRIDCHTRKPSTAIWLGVTKEEELIVINETSAPSLEELGDEIIKVNKEKEYRVIDMKMDNSGLSTGWNKDKRTAFDILRDKGLIVSPVKPKEKDVDDSILKIKRRLMMRDGQERPTLLFMENCQKTIQEMELYGWKESRHEERTGKSEKVMKVNDDFIDPLRYGVMAEPRFHAAAKPFYYGGGYEFNKKNSLADKLANYKQQKLKDSLSHGKRS